MKLISVILLIFTTTFAHFNVLKSDTDVVNQKTSNSINILTNFSHPFTQEIISKERPDEFYLIRNGKRVNLLNKLVSDKDGNHELKYKIKASGDYIFISKNRAYFEKDENKYITHIAKTIINSYQRENAWMNPVGLEAEIVPLTRPYGLKKGMLFSAKVLKNGKPAKNVMVEIEFFNDKNIEDEFHIYKTVTDEFGNFSFVAPYRGYFGFSALLEGEKIDNKESEIGAVLWVNFK